MPLNLDSLAPPILLRPSATLSDEQLMRFSAENKPYKIERNKYGDITIWTPVGGIASVHEGYVSGECYIWSKRDGSGKTFSPSGGFNLPDGSCLFADVAWMTLDRWNSLTLKQQTSFPPLCPDFVVEVRPDSAVFCHSERSEVEGSQWWPSRNHSGTSSARFLLSSHFDATIREDNHLWTS